MESVAKAIAPDAYRDGDGQIRAAEIAARQDSQPGPTSIALVLSGGGVRAMAFHLGVMRFLAERSLLERISHVSTVSGGSLLVGLMLQKTKMSWPRSSDFEIRGYQTLRHDMCTRSLMWAALRQLTWPPNWGHLLSRANLVAKALKGWGINHELSQLPVCPEWSINGTTAENGRRFRFKRDSMGDYRLGYAKPEGFPLAKAMAISAAFPGGIGPLSIRSDDYSWKKRDTWDTSAPEVDISLPYRRLRLYDGGVYDNLGLEPYFDAGERATKIAGVAIYVADAGAPLTSGPSAGPLSPWRVKRLADIMSEQSRTLRVRTFIKYLTSSAPSSGAYVYIDTQVEGGSDANWQLARSFPTSLQRLKRSDFDAIASHGYAVAVDIERQYHFADHFLGKH